MEIQSLTLAYFSPTGTTKSIVQAVARGMNQDTMRDIDITKPVPRKNRLKTSDKEILIIAVPVYLGRVPALLNEWLHTIKADNTPAVCIVVYGNRAYDDALIELKDILIKRGCKPIACAAYIGEHSFSTSETPIAQGRPDTRDLNHAESFGRTIHEKLLSAASIDQISDINIPGNSPYGGLTELWSVDFIAISNECRQCGTCAESCPVGAIDAENSRLIDKEKCITCCACIKSCPQNARTMKTSMVKDAAIRLHTLHKKRKAPTLFV